MTAPTPLLLGLALVACSGDSTDATPQPQDDTAATTPDPCQESWWYADTDGDGYGDPYARVASCAQPDGHVGIAGDCDDVDPQAHPDQVWFADRDGDGFGDPDASLTRCHRPLAHVADPTDCDDADPERHPDRFWYADVDGDGHGDPDTPVASCEGSSADVLSADDCDDTDPYIHPARVEVCDFMDNNCDGLVDEDDPELDVYTRVLFYEDIDGDGFGSDVELGEFCLSVDPGAVVAGDCDDTDADVFPGRLELPDAVDQNCDGETTFHLVADMPGVVGLGSAGYAPGDSFSTADLDADGTLDLFLGQAEDGDGRGRIAIIDGGASRDGGDAGAASVVWTGSETSDGLGAVSPISAGDMDGDGVGDLLVSIVAEDDGATGLLAVVDGSSGSGALEDVATWVWTGPAALAGEGFGRHLAAVGDLDGDGLGEVVVTADHASIDGTRNGAVLLLAGSSIGGTGDAADAPLIAGETAYSDFGSDLAMAGDADGDGVDEVYIAAPGHYDDLFLQGVVYRVAVTDLADGAFSLPDADRLLGESVRSRLGTSHALGDFTGDGYDDVLVVSTEHETSGAPAGTAYLVYGAVSLAPTLSVGSVDARLVNSSTEFRGSSKWASAISAPGDLDGDGRADLLVGMPGADVVDDYANNGVVAVYRGAVLAGIHSTLDDADALLRGDSSQSAGSGLAAAGDADADGLPDAWIGTPGAAELMLLPGALLQ